MRRDLFFKLIVNTVKVFGLVPGGTKSTLPDTLHHRDEVGDQPDNSNKHSRNQRFHSNLPPIRTEYASYKARDGPLMRQCNRLKLNNEVSDGAWSFGAGP